MDFHAGMVACERARDEPVAHPGWREAQEYMLGAISRGPAFLALLGPPGTGKTWLLQAILTATRQRGQRAMLVLRGEVPFEIDAGTVVLIDEAARMEGERLARLSGVRDASIVLADLPGFAGRLKSVARPPAFVRLTPLMPEEIPDFVAAWLASRGVAADIVDEGAMMRLIAHSGGVPRLLTQLLRAALARSAHPGAARIDGEDVDAAAALRLEGLGAAAAVTAPHSAASAVADQASPPAHAQPESGLRANPAPVGGGETPPVGGRRHILAGPALRPAGYPPLHRAGYPPPRRGRYSPLRRAGYKVAVPAIAAGALLAFTLANPGGNPPNEITRAVPIQNWGLLAEAFAPNASTSRSARSADAGGPEIPLAPAGRESGRALPAPPEPWSDARVATPHPYRSVPEATAALSGSKHATPASGLPDARATPASEQWAQAVPPPAAPGPRDERAGASLALPGSKPAPPAQPMLPALPAALGPMRPASAPHSITPPAEAANGSLVLKQIRTALAGPARRGIPGLVLVARAGDRMPALYAKVYRGLRAPPYSEVRAANPMRLRPGAIVVFPAPPGGWARR